MAIAMLAAVDFARIPALQFVVPVVSSDPAGYLAGLIYNSVEKALKFHDGAAWVAVAEAGSGGPPTGAAGGDLTGSYPNPQIAAGAIVDGDVNAGAAIAQSKISSLTADLAARVLKAGDAMSGNLAMGGNKVTGLMSSGALGTSDAAPVWYVDQRAAGIKVHTEVRAATTGPITLSGLQVVDGYQTVAGDRVLVRNQHNAVLTAGAAVANGIYVAASGAWTRAADADAQDEIRNGSAVVATQGITYGGVALVAQVPFGPWAPGTTDSYWAIFSGRPTVQGGPGLTLTGQTLAVVCIDGSLSVQPDSVSVVSAPKWTTARTLSLTGDVTGSVALDGSANASIATALASGASLAEHWAGDVPAGTACLVTHNLGTRDVVVEVYRSTAPYDTVLCDVERTSTTQVTLRFATAVAAAQYRAVITGR